MSSAPRTWSRPRARSASSGSCCSPATKPFARGMSSARPRPPPMDRRGGRRSRARLALFVDSARERPRRDRGHPALLPAADSARRSLTVTDPRATRLLMTSTEAVALALVGAAIGDSSGAFWLDVDPPVRIVDIARKLAAGREVDTQYIGLRPGENLEEESFSGANQTSATRCAGVLKTAAARGRFDLARCVDSRGDRVRGTGFGRGSPPCARRRLRAGRT